MKENADMDEIDDDPEFLGCKQPLISEESDNFIARARSLGFASFELELLTDTYLNEDGTLMT